MAKARRKRTTPSPAAADKPPARPLTLQEQNEALRKLASAVALPPEQVEAIRALALPREQVEALRAIAARERAIIDGTALAPPPRPQAKATTAEAGKLRGKKRLAADTVLALWREGYRWGDRETLLRKVRVRSGDKELSLRTLAEVLAHLRKRRLIDY
jgi:hypothetical protein